MKNVRLARSLSPRRNLRSENWTGNMKKNAVGGLRQHFSVLLRFILKNNDSKNYQHDDGDDV